MKKFILCFLILLMACPAWGADVYVSPQGNNLSAGTEAEPWLHVSRAHLLPADTVYIQGTTALNPQRMRSFVAGASGAGVGSEIKFGGETSMQYASHALNLSGIYEINSYTYWMDIWTSATDLTGWSESTVVDREPTEVITGIYSAKIAGSSILILNGASIPAENFRFHVIYKVETGGSLAFTVKNLTTNNYYQWASNTWTTGATFQGSQTSTTWAEYTSPWMLGETTGTYRLSLKSNTAGKVTYIDGFWIEVQPTWKDATEIGGTAGEFYINHQYEVSDPTVYVSSATEWASTGILGIALATRGTAGALNAGEYDIASSKVYYKPASGTMVDWHIEWNTEGSGYSCSSLNHNKVQNLTMTGARIGIAVVGTSAGFVASKFRTTKNKTVGFYVGGTASVSISDGEVDHHPGAGDVHGEGYQFLDSSTVVGNRLIAHHNDDDGFQPGNHSNVTLNYILSYYNGGTAMESSLDGTGGVLVVKNGTLISDTTATQQVLQLKGSLADIESFMNTIVYTTNLTYHAIDVSYPTRTTGALIFSNNLDYGGFVPLSWSGAPGRINADPIFVSATNFHLQSGSPAKGAGVNVGLVPLDPPDIGAEPYQQYAPWRH